MNCDEAAEFVSALYDNGFGDGEPVPREAAVHIGQCAECGERLRTYMEMGIELRRLAILETAEGKAARVPKWPEEQRRPKTMTRWWRKGWETMRIPRFAFAAMVAGIVVLASGLALTRVRARSEGSVVMLRVILPRAIRPATCALSLTDKNEQSCDMSSGYEKGTFSYKIQLLGERDGQLMLGIRTTAVTAEEAATHGNPPIMDAPQNQYQFTPGETLRVAMGSFGDMQITGEWMDHMPALDGAVPMDPGPDEFRIVSPMLIEGDRVVADWRGNSGFDKRPSTEATVYAPGVGRYQFYSQPHPGTVPGKVDENRVDFELEGKKYQLITGIPITRQATLWVRRDLKWRPEGHDGAVLSIGAPDPND